MQCADYAGYCLCNFGDKERFLSEGFDNYLEKPFTKAVLVDLVEKSLANKKK